MSIIKNIQNKIKKYKPKLVFKKMMFEYMGIIFLFPIAINLISVFLMVSITSLIDNKFYFSIPFSLLPWFLSPVFTMLIPTILSLTILLKILYNKQKHNEQKNDYIVSEKEILEFLKEIKDTDLQNKTLAEFKLIVKNKNHLSFNDMLIINDKLQEIQNKKNIEQEIQNKYILNESVAFCFESKIKEKLKNEDKIKY